MYCNKCGEENAINDPYCSKCGNKLKRENKPFNFDITDPFEAKRSEIDLNLDDDWPSTPSYKPFDSDDKSPEEDELLKAFIGSKYNSFNTNLFGILPKNIWVLFFAPLWFMYRKMRLYAIMIALLYVLISASLILFREHDLVLISIIIIVIIHIAAYLFSSKLYLSFAKKHVETIKREYPTTKKEKLKQYAREAGGTNLLSVIILMVIIAVVNVGAMFLLTDFGFITRTNRTYFQDSSGRYSVSIEIPRGWQRDETGTFISNGHCDFSVFFEQASFGREEMIQDIYGDRRNIRTNIVTKSGINWEQDDFTIDGAVVRIITTQQRNTIYLAHFIAFDDFRFYACEGDFRLIQETMRIR